MTNRNKMKKRGTTVAGDSKLPNSNEPLTDSASMIPLQQSQGYRKIPIHGNYAGNNVSNGTKQMICFMKRVTD